MSIRRVLLVLAILPTIVFFAITRFASEAGGFFGPDGVDWIKTFGVYLLPSILLTFVVLRHSTWLPPSGGSRLRQ